MHRVEEPGQEVDWVTLLVYGEALGASHHHGLHELVRTHLQCPINLLDMLNHYPMFALRLGNATFYVLPPASSGWT